MPARNGVQVEYERVEQDRDVPFDGIKVYVLIDMAETFFSLFSFSTPDSMSIWAKAITEQVWLSLVKAGQPVSSVTWVVDDYWSVDDLPIKQQDIRWAEDKYCAGWVNDNLPVNAPIIVVLVTDETKLNSARERALDKFTNICTFHKLLYPNALYLDTDIPDYTVKANNIYCSIPASYFEFRKPFVNGQRAGQQGGPAHR